MNENRIDTVAYMNAFAFMPYITDSIYDIKELLSYFEKIVYGIVCVDTVDKLLLSELEQVQEVLRMMCKDMDNTLRYSEDTYDVLYNGYVNGMWIDRDFIEDNIQKIGTQISTFNKVQNQLLDMIDSMKGNYRLRNVETVTQLYVPMANLSDAIFSFSDNYEHKFLYNLKAMFV